MRTTGELPASGEGAPPVSVEVWGPQALFTRPELKAERVSYEVMTPTAAIGVLEAIYWKPQFEWVPVAIDVLKPIKQVTQKRNETTDAPSLDAAATAGRRIQVAESRAQRNSVLLRDVAYRIHAHVALRDSADQPEAAYRAQFRRRVERGQCFHQPYLGTRECSAYFAPVSETPLHELTQDLGIMLHRVHRDRDTGALQSFSWFTARVDRGRMHIPRTGITAETPVEA